MQTELTYNYDVLDIEFEYIDHESEDNAKEVNILEVWHGDEQLYPDRDMTEQLEILILENIENQTI